MPVPCRSLIALLAVTATAFAEEAGEKAGSGPIRVSKETTRITEPLDEAGFVDYVEAVNRLQSAGVTTENNFEVVFCRVVGSGHIGEDAREEYFRRLGISVPPEKGGFVNLWDFSSDGTNGFDQALNDSLNDELSAVMSGPWQAADHPRAARWLQSIDGPLNELVEGTKRSRYYAPYVAGDFDEEEQGMPRMVAILLPSIQEQRSLARALLARAMLRIGSGDAAGAWGDLQAMHRQARHVAKGVTLIEALVGIALESMACAGDATLLASGKVTTDQLAAMQADLRKLPPIASMAEKLDVGERFMGLDAVQTFARHGLGRLGSFKSSLAGTPGGSWERVLAAFVNVMVTGDGSKSPIDWNETMRVMNGRYDALVAAARERDPVKREARFEEINAELKKLAEQSKSPGGVAQQLLFGGREGMGETMGNVLSGLLLPAVGQATAAADRVEAHLDVVRVGFALERYHRQHGEYPASLEVLAPAFLAEVPRDATTAKPLVYKPAENGFVLYSLGRNRQDDGGFGYDDRKTHPNADDLAVRVGE